MRNILIPAATLVAVVVLVDPRALIDAATIGAADESVTYHDVAAIPPAPYGPYPDARAVLTDTSSVAVGSVPAKWRQPLHHHDQEQVTMGLGGALGYSIGGVAHQLGSHGAGLPRPNVEHGMSNDSDQPALMLEYQPVLRREWLPPHPQVPPQPQSPQAMTLIANQPDAIDFGLSSSGWQIEKSGARVKSLEGRTIRVSFWDLSKAGASVTLAEPSSPRERLAFVLDGRVSSTVDGLRRDIGREMLMEVRNSAKDVTLRSLDQGPALVVIFEVR